MAVRKAAGLFDVSHMGELEVEGPGALAFLQRVTSQQRGQARGRPGAVLGAAAADGAPVDDVIVYRRGAERFLLVVNAANIEKDFPGSGRRSREGCELVDRSDDVRAARAAGAARRRRSCSR